MPGEDELGDKSASWLVNEGVEGLDRTATQNSSPTATGRTAG